MATIRDIAKLAGVSRGTVDRVLHGRGRVSEENEEKIRKALAELDYQPSEAGMALAAHKKDLHLGFLYPEMEQGPFFAKVYQAARKKAEELAPQGVDVRFFPVREEDIASPQKIIDLLRWLRDHTRISGWALPGTLVQPLRTVLLENEGSDVPMVAYNMDSDVPGCLAYVGCDYHLSGRMACGLAALMSGGKGKVLLMSVDAGNLSSSAQRLDGFEEEMKNKYPDMRVAARVLSSRDYFGAKEAAPKQEETPENEDAAQAFDAVAKACRLIREDEEINVVYIANPGNYSVCPQLRKAAFGRKISIITNDLVSEEQRKMLADGVIDATICQDPGRQGTRPLEILYDVLAFHRTPEAYWEKTRLTIETDQSLRQDEND